MDFVIFEFVSFVVWLLLIFGFYDRVFHLLCMTIGFFFSAWSMTADNGFYIINQVYNSTTQTWILYETSVYPYILIMVVPVIVSFMIFIRSVLPNTDNDVFF